VTPERVDGSVDLRSYAAIGDGRTVALIARDGSVDWLPMTALDGAPVFGRLLDAENGGAVTLEPDDPYEVSRRYLPGTNVLETTFTTANGVATVTDALVTGVAGRLPWTELARRIDGVRGSVSFSWAVAPGTAFGLASPWVQDSLHGPIIRVGRVLLAVRGSEHGEKPDGHRSITGAFATSARSRHVLTIVGNDAQPLHLPVADNVDVGIDRTIENWEAWSRTFSYEGPWADAVQRSALALKLLIFAPSGAIAAAATTSLPESVDGAKRWDYRFAWVRDVSYTLSALIRFGVREETQAAVAWLLDTVKSHGLHIFYALDGSRPDEPQELTIPGWRGAAPVVLGNPARDQLQLGIYGDLFAMMSAYVEAGNVLDAETGRLLSGIADTAADSWRSPDSGMWELPVERRYTASRMGCWLALDNAVRLAKLGQIPGDADRWSSERDAIAEWVRENCWSEEKQSYVAYPGTDELDTTVLLHSVTGFDRGPRMSSTIDAIRTELGEGPLLYRYTGAQAEEGAFVACGFWMASALACVGRDAEASALMDDLVALGNDVGLFAEMIQPDSGAFLGNLPQALSHLALINAAITIDELT
jgi:GH15 family glucan-1,4-alpha-glucosidase